MTLRRISFVTVCVIFTAVLMSSCGLIRDNQRPMKVDELGEIIDDTPISTPTPSPTPADMWPQPTDAGQYPNDRQDSALQQSSRNNLNLPPPNPVPVTQAPRFPWGRKIAGRPGFVLSPYAPNQGIVDVTDPATGQPYPRGTEVQCPFTNRIFLVP
jgi:hypothetical protein